MSRAAHERLEVVAAGTIGMLERSTVISAIPVSCSMSCKREVRAPRSLPSVIR